MIVGSAEPERRVAGQLSRSKETGEMPTSVRKRLEDLAKIAESTIWSRCPDAASQTTVDVLAETLDCQLAFIHLLDVTGDHLINFAVHGELPKHVPQIRVSITTGRMLQMMMTHQPIIMDFLHPDPADSMPDGPIHFRSAVSVPLLAGNDVLGMFTIVYKRHKRWTGQDIEYLIDIGRLLGIAVQHAQTARKTADLEILLERKRLSGEIHDNLSQLISSLNLGAESALLSWEEGNPDRLRKDLERIRFTSQEAAQTLREEMLSLRTPSNETEGLIPGVRECLKRFEHQWKIDTDLQVQEGLEPLIVSTQMELQFMRILHESLSNVLRHSSASHVSVLLQGNHSQLSMQINDDGRGFDPEAVSCERLGLRIMHERAESIGGELTIGSGNGTGTTVHVDVPRYA
jgi:signal transduction histidine kinase